MFHFVCHVWIVVPFIMFSVYDHCYERPEVSQMSKILFYFIGNYLILGRQRILVPIKFFNTLKVPMLLIMCLSEVIVLVFIVTVCCIIIRSKFTVLLDNRDIIQRYIKVVPKLS